MRKTGLAYHEGCLKHVQGFGHPECPERISTTMEYFKETGLLKKVKLIRPEPASVEEIQRVHTPEHVEMVRGLSEGGGGYIDYDTAVCPDTFEAALLAAGGVLAACDSVMRGEVDNCFALVRPPGHHASAGRAAGFCYFNNLAAAIRHLQDGYGLKRVAVFDWDAHAGNGMMEIFYGDPSVLKISVHQDPRWFYPGTGFVEQVGEGAGRGYVMNIPVPAGTGDADYAHILDSFALQKIRDYKPELIAVSAGQDSHRDDGISGLQLTDEGYAAMTGRLLKLADEVCGGRLVLELEGGYNLETLPRTHHRIVSALMGEGGEAKVEGVALDSTIKVLEQLENALENSAAAP